MITQIFIILLGVFSVLSGFVFFWRSVSPYRWYVLCKVIGTAYLTAVYIYFIIHGWIGFPASRHPDHDITFVFLFIRPGAIMLFSWLILDAYLRSWGRDSWKWGKNDN
jgi:hypothetical protein